MVEKQGIDATVVRLGNLPAEANPRGARPSRARRVQPLPRFNTPPRFPPTTTFPAITPRIFCLVYLASYWIWGRISLSDDSPSQSWAMVMRRVQPTGGAHTALLPENV